MGEERGTDVDQGPVGMVKYAWVLMLHRMPAVSLAGCGWNWCGDEEVGWFECVVEITVSDRLCSILMDGAAQELGAPSICRD